ncbi:MAG: phosphoribosylformylglycinamidine cyclo-ligase [candidate division KSB1 bacterium]|nr:phosphoribosylformylglycinamidine cyclo-ligase [candidate division KSB1 bacterium]
MTYRQAGVDIDAAEEAVDRIKALARSTYTERVLTDIGLFAGLFDGRFAHLKHPVLASSIDGVGTKVKIAVALDRHDTVGQDLVNHCVNDIMTSGSQPLFFLDYIGTSHLKPAVVEQIVAGIARACRENGCALIGGEMAEMPGVYAPGDYDLVGTIVGVVDKDRILDGKSIQAGDVLIGLPSTGLHTNGYSLARKVLLDHAGLTLDGYVDELGATLGEELLKVHRSYKLAIETVLAADAVKGIAHVTGGGIEGNTRRLLRRGLTLRVRWGEWEEPPIFALIRRLGKVPEQDMRRTFNLGIGLVLVCAEEKADVLTAALREVGESPQFIGEVVASPE